MAKTWDNYQCVIGLCHTFPPKAHLFKASMGLRRCYMDWFKRYLLFGVNRPYGFLCHWLTTNCDQGQRCTSPSIICHQQWCNHFQDLLIGTIYLLGTTKKGRSGEGVAKRWESCLHIIGPCHFLPPEAHLFKVAVGLNRHETQGERVGDLEDFTEVSDCCG